MAETTRTLGWVPASMTLEEAERLVGEKFEAYRTPDSFQEYALVAQDRRRVEVFRKNEAGRWELFEFSDADAVTLASVNAEIGMDALYENVKLDG